MRRLATIILACVGACAPRHEHADADTVEHHTQHSEDSASDDPIDGGSGGNGEAAKATGENRDTGYDSSDGDDSGEAADSGEGTEVEGTTGEATGEDSADTGEYTGDTSEETGDETGDDTGEDTGEDTGADTGGDGDGDETGDDTGEDTTGGVVLRAAAEQCSDDSECATDLICLHPGNTAIDRGLCAPACVGNACPEDPPDAPSPYGPRTSICVQDANMGTALYCAIDATISNVCRNPVYTWERYQPWPGVGIRLCVGAEPE